MNRANIFFKAVFFVCFFSATVFFVSGSKAGAESLMASPEDALTIVIQAENVHDERIERDIKYYLPEGVDPQHLLSKSGFSIKYDASRGRYYLTRNFAFEPKETRFFSIQVENVWRIPAGLIEAYRDNAEELYRRLIGTEHESLGYRLYRNILTTADEIIDSQDIARSVQEYVDAAQKNEERIKTIENDLRRLKELLTEPGRRSEGEEEEGLSLANLIVIISSFILVVTVVLFVFWIKSSDEKSENKKHKAKGGA